MEAQGNTKKQSKPNQTEETQAAKRKRERERRNPTYTRWDGATRIGAENLYSWMLHWEERKKGEREKKKGNKEKLRIMHHATLRFLFKKEWTERGRGEDVCVYRNKTCDEIRWWWRWSPLGSTEDGLGGKWQIGEERWRQRERETPLRGAQQLHRRHWKKTLDRKMRLCASLHHLLTEKL